MTGGATVTSTASLELTVTRWFEKIPNECPESLRDADTRNNALSELRQIRDGMIRFIDATELKRGEDYVFREIALGAVGFAVEALELGEHIGTAWEKAKRSFIVALDRLRTVPNWVKVTATVEGLVHLEGLLQFAERARHIIEGLLF